MTWPEPPGPFEAPGPPAPSVPEELRTACRLWLVSIVVGVVGSVLSLLTTPGSLSDDLAAQLGPEAGLSAAQVDGVVQVALVLAAVLALAVVALEVWLVFRMRAGRRWARTILLVLGTFSLVSALVALPGADLAPAAVTLLQAGLLVAAIVYLFTDTARAHFVRPTR